MIGMLTGYMALNRQKKILESSLAWALKELEVKIGIALLRGDEYIDYSFYPQRKEKLLKEVCKEARNKGYIVCLTGRKEVMRLYLWENTFINRIKAKLNYFWEV